jgi:magnesium transporter
MLDAFLFDRRRGEPVDDWRDVVAGLGDKQVLWLDLEEPTGEEIGAVATALELSEDEIGALGEDATTAHLAQRDAHIGATIAAVNEEEAGGPAPYAIRCVVGSNWVVTTRGGALPVFDEFRELATGEGELGVLDGPSFLAALVEWTISSYLRAFEAIEARLEEFDLSVLASTVQDDEQQIEVLVEMRRSIGKLRRSLAPQRELFGALSHSEYDLLSTSESADRFARLTGRVDAALAAARDAKDSVFGSFDVLNARTDHRTNEIMKVLTLASVLLLPGALIAGVMGMNFKVGLFEHAEYFWGVLAVIVALALVTVAAARARRWI